MSAVKSNNDSKEEKPMRACATAGGGVMFIPDELEVEQKAFEKISYKDLIVEEKMNSFESVRKIIDRVKTQEAA